MIVCLGPVPQTGPRKPVGEIFQLCQMSQPTESVIWLIVVILIQTESKDLNHFNVPVDHPGEVIENTTKKKMFGMSGYKFFIAK